MIEPVEISAVDFIEEIRIAPKWNIFQYYQGGYFDLFVYYGFGTFVLRSPSMQDMQDDARKAFYKDLSFIINVPSIRKAKIQ